MTTIRIQVAPRVAPDNPRGARVAAAVVIAMWRLFAGLGRRAPTQARTAAQEAQDVRELALTHQTSDPRFAAELFAAADRHERLHGVD
jgi:hypothetical protein